MKKITLLSIITAVYFVFAAATYAQQSSVFTTGLQGPTKIITAGQSHLLVTETGTPAPNTSRVSLVDRTTGARRTLIGGLPSAFNSIEQAPSGASALKLSGLKLYITIGQGDSVIPGGRGDLKANPYPATPLNNSVLELTLPADYEVLTSAFTLFAGNQATLAGGAQVSLQNAEGKSLNVRLVANLPDYKMEHRPFLPQGNVRPANVFGVETAGGNLYVVDASFNQVYKINPLTGAYETFAEFAPYENPLPFGPPFSEAVPDNIRLYGNRLLVPHLTGFPFAPGNSTVMQVSLADGSQESLFRGLTSAMDVLPVPISGLYEAFYVLEFSANMLGNPTPPGKLKLFVNEDEPVVLLSNLISPTSMARDGETGDLFITEIFTGRIIRVPGTFSPMTQLSNSENGQSVCSPCTFPLRKNK
jgi:hypothetical protein